MSENEKARLRSVEQWNKERDVAVRKWIESRGFSDHPLLDNEEIQIVMAQSFSAGARWERDRQCSECKHENG